MSLVYEFIIYCFWQWLHSVWAGKCKAVKLAKAKPIMQDIYKGSLNWNLKSLSNVCICCWNGVSISCPSSCIKLFHLLIETDLGRDYVSLLKSSGAVPQQPQRCLVVSVLCLNSERWTFLPSFFVVFNLIFSNHWPKSFPLEVQSDLGLISVPELYCCSKPHPPHQ